MKELPKAGAVVYLASPYSNKSAKVREERYLEVVRFMAMAITDPTLKLLLIYSPIIIWHPVALFHELPTNAVFWREQNQKEMKAADCLFVLEIDGWKESIGVSYEIELARAINKPIFMAQPDYFAGEVILCPIR